MKLIYQFLYLINGYLFFRCLEKEARRNENKKKETVEVLQQAIYGTKRTRK